MAQLKNQYDQAVKQLTQPGSAFELATRVIAGNEQTVFANAPATMLEIYAAAAAHGAREFLVYEGERWTFEQLLQQAASFGHQLVNHFGIGKGDRVAIAMRNYPEWMSSFIAISSVGAVVVPLNSWGLPKDLEFALADAEAKVVFCDQQRLDLIADRLDAMNIAAVLVRPERDNLPARAISAATFIKGHETAAMPTVELSSNDAVMQMYTSGTTGKPKGAVSTHFALCQAISNFECAAYASAMINPEAINAMMKKGYEPTQMLAVPLFHVSGCHAVFLTALKAGRRVVMLYKWDVARALQYIEAEKVTILSAAPSMLQQLLESPLFNNSDTSSLSSVGGGGSATPPRVARLIEEKIPCGYPGAGWGMTETNAIGTAFTGQPFKRKPGSAGFCHATVTIEARDPEGKVLPPGEAGELWLKSPTVVREYWNRPDANAADFKDGWFNSGDIGYFDTDGYLYLSDRAKDVVIRAGENIYPAEIEAAIYDMKGVLEVAAFGVADEKLGEQLAVAVVTQPGVRLTADDVKNYARGELAAYKIPFYVWIMEQALPKTATGKVLKKDVKAQCVATLKAS